MQSKRETKGGVKSDSAIYKRLSDFIKSLQTNADKCILHKLTNPQLSDINTLCRWFNSTSGHKHLHQLEVGLLKCLFKIPFSSNLFSCSAILLTSFLSYKCTTTKHTAKNISTNISNVISVIFSTLQIYPSYFQIRVTFSICF